MDIDGSEDILTKAKLYATMSDDDSWTEMGVGVVSVVLRPSVSLDGEDGDSSSISGSTDHNPERSVGHLEMIDIDNPDELLMSTPITLSDAYIVQHETILWWSDPQLGRLMACSFNTREGCEKIYKEITAYQRSRKSVVSREVNGADVISPQSICSHWVVCRENLPAILSAATTNAQRFGVYVRGCDTYFKELAELFQVCQRDGDVRGMDLTGQITLALLRTPFNTDGKIIAQFVENTLVDQCVDIVQYAIGRRDRSTGFVSSEERRATFRNPLGLPEFIVARIHVLYSCGYLKDLLPLSLDEADAMPSSLLSTYLVSTKFRLLEEICRSPTIIPQGFMRAYNNVGNSFDVVAFIHDMCKTIKNSMLPLESKASMFEALVEAGLLPFLRFVLENTINLYEVSRPSAELQLQEPLVVTPGMAMQMACDIVCNCIMLWPAARGNLMSEATSNPNGCLLELLLQCILTGKRGTELQAAVDAIISCGVGILQYLPSSIEMGGTTKQDVVRFWVVGVTGRRSPLLPLATHIAKLLTACEKIRHGSHEEVCVVHALKILTALMGDMDDHLSLSCADVFGVAGLMPAFAAALRVPSRSAANVQSSVVAFVAAVIGSGRWHVVERLLGDGVFLDVALNRYFGCGQRSNVLSASLAHLFDVLCRAIHREKSARAQLYAPTANSRVFCFLSTAAEEDMSACGDGAATAGEVSGAKGDAQGRGRGVCQPLGSALWVAHEKALRVRFPTLAAKLEHALHETPEEAQSADAETSSVASTMERGVKGITDGEFDAMVAEFGVELQPLRHFAPSFGGAASLAACGAGQTDDSTQPARKCGREEEEEPREETIEPLLKRHKRDPPTPPPSSPSLFSSTV